MEQFLVNLDNVTDVDAVSGDEDFDDWERGFLTENFADHALEKMS